MKFKTLLIAALSALCASVLVVGAQVPGVNSTLNSVFTLTYDNSTMKPTYSATGGAGQLPTNSTDVCGLAGSASKTIKVRRILISGAATSVATDPVAVVKRSTANANASGTPLALALVPYDSANSAGTAAFADIWTVAPTLGTMVGVLSDPLVTFNNFTTGIGNGPTQLYYGEFGSPIVLRGVAQMVAVNLGGGSPAGLQLTCTFEWTEE